MNTVKASRKPIHDALVVDPADGREMARLPWFCANRRAQRYVAADNLATEASDAR
jgi:hypothetical protein